MPSKIIDAHVHLSGRRDDLLNSFARMNGLTYSLNELLSEMRKHRVRCALLLSPPLGNAPLPNQEVLKFCRASNGLLCPVITVEPNAKAVKAAVKLAEANRNLVKAFKVRLGYVNASAESRHFDAVYDYAESKRLPVMFHTGDTVVSSGRLVHAHPISLDGLANKREELVMILCHFGNPWFMDAAELVYKHQNVYADISGLITSHGGYKQQYQRWLARRISESIYFIGDAKKIIFGTDYPVTKHTEALALVNHLRVDSHEKESILWRNAERVFRL